MAKTIIQGIMKEQGGEDVRKRDWKTISKNGQEWDLEIPLEQRNTRKPLKALLQ